MPAKVIFTCETCGSRPDSDTQTALEHQLLDLRHGEYVDAAPGDWLTWHGQGLYGRTCYACGEHRGELKAAMREAPAYAGVLPFFHSALCSRLAAW